MFFEAGKISSRLLVLMMIALELEHSDLFLKITKMGRLLLAGKIKIKQFRRENRNLKTLKLIIAIKHVLNIEIGPQMQN